jgi:4-hydroxybenzoate polyprenyltransferase
MLPLTAIVPVWGYWSVLGGIGDWWVVFQLLGVGASAHIFGFGLNDIVDLSIDKQTAYRNDSPLVKGTLSLTTAWTIVLLQIPLMFFLYHLNGGGEKKILGDGLLLISILLSMVYNFFSKRGKLKRWLAEVSLALSIGFLCLAGSYLFRFSIAAPAIIYAISFSLVLLSINSLGSGLKDLKTDLEAGGQSFVIENGARMIGADQIFISKKLKVFGYTLQVFILLSFVAYLWAIGNFHVLLILSFICWGFGFLHLRHLLSQKKFTLIHQKAPLLYGYLNLVSLTLLLAPAFHWGVVVFISFFGCMLILFYFRYKYQPKP